MPEQIGSLPRFAGSPVCPVPSMPRTPMLALTAPMVGPRPVRQPLRRRPLHPRHSRSFTAGNKLGRQNVGGFGGGARRNRRHWDECALCSPTGIARDTNGVLYIVDSVNHTIRTLELLGGEWQSATISGGAGYFGFTDGLNEFAEYNNPSCITLSPAGTLYVTDFGNSAIRQLTNDPAAGMRSPSPASAETSAPLTVRRSGPILFSRGYHHGRRRGALHRRSKQ